jgi:eukaryotic-like serine/threonine-protein kinase
MSRSGRYEGATVPVHEQHAPPVPLPLWCTLDASPFLRTMQPGTRLGSYEILARLGAGGMGEVYRARQLRLGREVAIKILPAHLRNDPEMLQRFEREAQSIAALSHPNILSIHDFVTERDVQFAVMELLEGTSLRGQVFPWRRALQIGAAIADGLAAAHASGIVHRDLKPDNVFLTVDGQVKILDFGLARSQVPALSEATVTDITSAGMVLGTVGYMSPEQARGEPAGIASDIFSFGCILYEVLSGRKAFDAPTPAEVIAAVLRDPAPDLPPGESPAVLNRVIARCLEKNIERRYPSALDLAAHLREILLSSDAATLSARASLNDSLLVLPFQNIGGDAGAEYLSDGIAESIINVLSQVTNLRVIPRAVAFQYRGQDTQVFEIGRKLKVRMVLTGRVVQRQEKLAIQADLVDVDQEAQLWGERFRAGFTDLFDVEEQIASQIVKKLRMRLSGADQDALARRDTQNPEAYQHYLKGIYYWNKLSFEALKPAMESFQAAIQADPEYARAYEGLALALLWAGHWALSPPRDWYAKAKPAAERALELDAGLCDAHAVLANTAYYLDHDWQAADYHLACAWERNPNSAVASHARAYWLCAQGEFDAACDAAYSCMELEPLSSIWGPTTAIVLNYARRYEETATVVGKVVETDANLWLGRYFLGWAHYAAGHHSEALFVAHDVMRLANGHPAAQALLASVLAARGEAERARAMVAELRKQPLYVSPYNLALACLATGDREAALQLLERSIEYREWQALYAGIDPLMESLQGDERFEALVARHCPPRR